MMHFLSFPDKTVTYDVFMDDLADRVAEAMLRKQADPEYVSQNKAFALFGRANVERWRRQGKVQPCKRPGKMEYRTADLRRLQRTQQDYF